MISTQLIAAHLSDVVNQDLLGESLCIAVINSFAEGFANETSDFDIAVVVRDEGPFGAAGEHWKQLRWRGTRVDAWVIPKGVLLSRLQSIDLGSIEAQVEFAHKIRSGLPLLGHHEWAHLRAMIRWEKFDEAVQKRHLAEASFAIEDVAGYVGEGDLFSALLRQRTAVGSAIDALLAREGETQPRIKWRVKKLRKTFGDDNRWFREYLQYELAGCEKGLDYCRAKLEEGSNLFQRLVCEVICRGMQSSIELASCKPSRALQVPEFMTVSYLGDALVAHNPAPVCKLSVREVLIWGTVVHGISPNEINQVVSTLPATSGNVPSRFSEAEVADITKLLVDRSLLLVTN